LREYATVLRTTGGRTATNRVQTVLQQALALYEELGLEHAAEATRVQLAETPTPARKSPAYPDGLTEREAEALRLVAARQTNREIAAALVVSRNTVGFHVKSIFNKTGVANRAEATSYAHRHRLIAPPP